eukprot:TRINITY_DN7740_c0_g1_i7.p1 TRINITY_DN7740_c0_g1~~TRINITY_DN7740_c0_g1_i7.p1  ORF type:complete len:229 (+),score=54.98 TRINITY_DN7740_c0_g1_i7:79-765(+)
MGGCDQLVYVLFVMVFFFFSSRRRHTRCREVSWARRCVQETGTWDWQGKEEPPRYTSFMQWFSYIFPNVRITDREIRDDNDIERRVNHALIYGLRSDVEIFRCRKTIATTPHYRQYLKEANRLRDEYRDVILNGEFRDNDYFQSNSNEITASCFIKGDKLAVMATQSHRENLTFKLKTDGFKLTHTDGLNTWHASAADGDTYDVKLGRHGLVLLLLDKEQSNSKITQT